MKFELKPNNRNPQIPDLIEDIKRVASLLHQDSLTSTEYKKFGRWNVDTPIRYFGTWNKAIAASGLIIKKRINIPEIELLDNLKDIWMLNGRQPFSSEIIKPLSKFDLSVYTRKYGSWRKALELFVAKVQEEEFESLSNNNEDKQNNEANSRNINLRLRFFIMNRDHFKCVKCGKSPATDNRIILHVDHILPWSKGGKTIEQNLQTLCSDCNYGKSDIIMK